MTVGGPSLRIVVDGKEYRFERDYSGCPWLLDRRGEPKETPGERSKFWRGFNCWLRQGTKVEGDLCVWTVPPRANKVRRINSRGRWI
jgi:hypothetical protein